MLIVIILPLQAIIHDFLEIAHIEDKNMKLYTWEIKIMIWT